MTIPTFYPDNVTVLKSETVLVRGNEVSDLTGSTVTAYNLNNIKNLRAKNNKALRIRSPLGNSTGFDIDQVADAVLVYNVASRVATGFEFGSIPTLEVYNTTVNNCTTGFSTASAGTFRNIALSAIKGNSLYRVSNGFVSTAATAIDIDYIVHSGLATLASGIVTEGDTITEELILYIDEENDDLIPDYVSALVNSGTANPLLSAFADIGGIESPVTTEATAAVRYWYSLIDNVFWDTGNTFSVESSFIRAFQSRVLANTEVTVSAVQRDTHVKLADSMARFSELYPMNARYATQTRFKKRVMDMWYAGQNPATIQSYQNSIGGYNLFPSFFKRMEDYEDGWIIGVSFVGYDNWLNSMEDLKYGIGIDVLGTSTMNQATSGECYSNVMSTVADIAPVRWFLHDEVQPSGYLVFTDMWNNFENCTLSNMHYNDDFNLGITDVDQAGRVITPLISTLSVLGSGVPSGDVEVSLLDRRFSEDVSREFYYRQGTSVSAMSAWEELTVPIGSVLEVTDPYLQFRIAVDDAPAEIDYEFMGISLRQYTSARDWTRPQISTDFEYIEFMPGASLPDNFSPPVYRAASFSFPNDGVAHAAGWSVFLPESLRTEIQTIRMYFSNSLASGDARVLYQIVAMDETLGVIAPVSATLTVPIIPGPLVSMDIPLAGVFTATTYSFYLQIERDSSVAGDVLASDLDYIMGRTL